MGFKNIDKNLQNLVNLGTRLALEFFSGSNDFIVQKKFIYCG